MKNKMLYNKTAENIYENIKNLPIIDYHCHLNIMEILEDKPFNNLTEIWLYHDHYKWRQMRTFGVPEEYITGGKSDREKFDKYMEMLSLAIGQPLYAWSKLELEQYFDIDCEILPDNFDFIWEKSMAVILKEKLSPRKLIKMSNVEAIGIIEDAAADLTPYKNVIDGAKIVPVLRGDKLLANELTFDEIKEKFPIYLQNFLNCGANSADFSFEKLEEKDELVFKKLKFMLSLCYEKGLVVQLHISPIRNNNKKMFNLLGSDNGFDSISEKPYLSELIRLFNEIGEIGKTIIFNLNPADNAKIVTLCGCFVGDGIPGKAQWGAGWWFNDTAEGIKQHLELMANNSLLSTFVGMLTDSRSFISYPRHDYFRRILCDFVGEKVEKGEFTNNLTIINKLLGDICYYNAKKYFNI